VYVPYTWPCTCRVPCTRPSLRPVCTALYVPCTRPCMVRPRPEHGRVHGRVPCTRPCLRLVYSTRPVNGRVLPMDTAVFTARVRGRVRTMYMAVHGPSMTRTRPCTRSCTLYTAVFTARVQYTASKRPCTADGHGRVYGPCTRPCTVYMHVFVACVYGRQRPCTDCVRAMYMVRS